MLAAGVSGVRGVPAAGAVAVGIEARVGEEIARLMQDNEDRMLGRTSALQQVLDGDTSKLVCLKALDAKVAVVDAAIAAADGNLLTAAVLHMRDTLSRRLFHRELGRRAEAEEAYVQYLRATGQVDLALDLLTMTGRHEEAAMTKLRQCLAVSGLETRIRLLRHCRQNFFAADEALQFWGSLVEEEAALLERQLPIEEEDRRAECLPTSEVNAKFLQVPRRPLPGLPLLTTLFYCCLYHWDLPENCLASPASVRKSFDLTDRQFLATALTALSLRKRWSLVDALFQVSLPVPPHAVTRRRCRASRGWVCVGRAPVCPTRRSRAVCSSTKRRPSSSTSTRR